MNSSSASPLVIDAGVGYMLCVESAASAALRAELAAGAGRNLWLCAPDLWRYELTSIITKAVHFQQLSETLARETLQLANHLNVQLFQPDNELVLEALDWTRRLKRAAAYNSFYLALARRLDCELWTTDRRLVNAVGAPWVRHLGSAAQEHPA